MGYQGVGSHLELLNRSGTWVLRETVRSQLFTILTLAIIGLLPIWLLTSRIEKIKGGMFAYAVLSLSSFVGFAFGAKYLMRLLGQRRVEFDLATKSVRLFAQGSTAEQTFAFNKVTSLKCSESDYTSAKTVSKNYSFIVTLTDGTEMNLATSDRAENAKTIFEKLSQILPGANG